jgi:cbb3-type cytochrome oxidase maturation protein
MEVAVLLVFVSLVLVLLAVGLFVWSVKSRTHEHIDRLALLPLLDEPIVRDSSQNSARTRNNPSSSKENS